MSRHFGYLLEQGPQGVVREADTATCGHCQYVMFVPPAKNGQLIVRVGSACSICRKFICNVCQASGKCDPWEKQMERIEASARR